MCWVVVVFRRRMNAKSGRFFTLAKNIRTTKRKQAQRTGTNGLDLAIGGTKAKAERPEVLNNSPFLLFCWLFPATINRHKSLNIRTTPNILLSFCAQNIRRENSRSAKNKGSKRITPQNWFPWYGKVAAIVEQITQVCRERKVQLLFVHLLLGFWRWFWRQKGTNFSWIFFRPEFIVESLKKLKEFHPKLIKILFSPNLATFFKAFSPNIHTLVTTSKNKFFPWFNSC